MDKEARFNYVVDELSKESDRASVILSATFIDQELETVLKSFLVSTEASEDNLFDGAFRPLSTFSARIDMAFRLGLITKEFARLLHLIRKIRNEFSHNIEGCNFENMRVQNMIIEMRRITNIDKSISRVLRNAGDGESVETNVDLKTTKGKYIYIVSWVLHRIWDLISIVEPLSDLKAFDVRINDVEDDK